MKRRLLLTVLILLLAVALLPAGLARAEAEGVAELADWEYTLDAEAGTVTLNKYVGTATAVTVPGAFTVEEQSYSTVVNSQTIFRGNTEINSVTLEAGVSFLNNTMRLLCCECKALTNVDLSAVDSAGVTNMGYMFYMCPKLKTVDLSGLDTALVTTMRSMFYECNQLSDIAGLSGFDTHSLQDMSFMFYNCSKLKTLDLSGLDTGMVTTMRCLFYECKLLSEITGLSDFDTHSLQDMSFMFNKVGYSVSASTPMRIDLSGWDLDQLLTGAWCFQNCRVQEILVPDNLAIISAGFMNHATRWAGSVYTVPAGVKKIGYAHTFYDFATNDFVEFRVAEGNEYYQAIDGILYSGDGTELLAIPRNKPFENGVYEVPEGVSFFGELSFSRNYNIHTVVLPDSYVIEYVPVYDPRYVTYEDTGNLNAGTNLSIAIYCYTGVTAYAVKDSNPNYASRDGVIYSRDYTHVVAVPARYDQPLELPEGVKYWDREAMWADGGNTVDNLFANCSGVSLPASLKTISEDQLAMLNRLHQKRAGTENPFTITLAEGNTAFDLDEDGYLVPRLRITVQPADAGAALNATVRTELAAEGEGLKYQWYLRDPGKATFSKSGLKGTYYSVDLIKSKVGREVYCVITDKYGNKVTSRTATLYLQAPSDYELTITRQPEDAWAELGKTVRTDFEASGTGLSYQWYYRDPGKTAFSKSGLTGRYYSVALVAAKNGREVYCVVTDVYGNTVQTDTVTLRVRNPEEYVFAIVEEPADCVVKKGKTATATVVATGEGLKYQWYGRDPGQTSFWKSSIRTDTYSVKLIQSKAGREIYCVVTDAYGNTLRTRTVTLNIG